MDDQLGRVRRAYEALLRGEVDPLVSLFDPDLDWRGAERGIL
jgi:hypothetical protein